MFVEGSRPTIRNSCGTSAWLALKAATERSMLVVLRKPPLYAYNDMLSAPHRYGNKVEAYALHDNMTNNSREAVHRQMLADGR